MARCRLCWGVTIAVFVSILVIEALILIPSYLNFEREILERQEQIGRGIMVAAAQSLPANASAQDLAERAQRLTARTILRGGAILDRGGRMLATFGERPELAIPSGPLSEIIHGRTDDGRRVEVCWPASMLGVPYMMIARLDASNVSGELSRFVWRIVGLVCLIAAFVTIVTMIILGRTVLSPLLRLRANMVAAGADIANAENFAVDHKRKDEFGDVVSAYNDLLGHVSSGVAALEARNLDLSQSEERFRKIFEGSTDSIFVVDPDRDEIVDANGEACNMLGYRRKELLRRRMSDIHPKEMDKLRVFAEGVFTHGRARTTELSCLTKSGEFIPVEIAASQITIGGRDLMLALARNMTEQRAAELALRDSEERYRNLVEYAPDGIMIHQNGKIVFANPAAVEMLKADSREQIIGRRAIDLIHPDYRDIAKKRIRLVQNEQKRNPLIEVEILALDGGSFAAEAMSIPFSHQKKPAVEFIFRDVSARKKAEDAFKASQDRLAGFLSIAKDAVISIDQDHRITLFNRGAQQIFGYREKEILGKSLDLLLPERFRDAHGESIEDFAVGPNVSRAINERAEITGRRKNGEEFPAEGSIVYLEHAGERTYTVMLRDITERKQAEEERALLTEQFHRAQRMEAIGTLAGGIAHDFNNLLVSIQGYTDLSLEELPADHPVRAHQVQVQKASQRAQDLIHKILDFSRRRDERRHAIRPEAVVREALELFQASLPAGIQLETIIVSNPGRVLASETTIHQVVMNLCVNAGQAIGDRPGSIAVCLEDVDLDRAHLDAVVRACKARKSKSEPARPAVMFGTIEPGAFVHLSVSDTGCGMERATMTRIFEPFFTKRQAGEGTGLGLSTVHGIVTGYDGAVVVESAPGKGTTFHVYLQRLEPQATPEIVEEAKMTTAESA